MWGMPKTRIPRASKNSDIADDASPLAREGKQELGGTERVELKGSAAAERKAGGLFSLDADGHARAFPPGNRGGKKRERGFRPWWCVPLALSPLRSESVPLAVCVPNQPS